MYGAAGRMLMQPQAGGALVGHPTQKTFAETHHKEPPAPKPNLSIPALIAFWVCPWFIFTVVLYSRGMWTRYAYPWLSICLAAWFLIFALVVGVMTFSALRNPKQGDPRLLGLMFAFCVLAWVWGVSQGGTIFLRFTRPYYDLVALNTYPSVDPSKFSGAQMMDAGIIAFKSGAKLDLTKSIGFKNEDVYCVVPVTMEGAGDKQKHYHFWAVGTNCCSSHTSNYQCGEWNLPSAHMGLRLMNEEQRPYFRLAVKEAEAAYNIEADHPVFMHWLTDAVGEVEAYQDDAYKYFLAGTCFYGAFQLFLVIVASFIVFKI